MLGLLEKEKKKMCDYSLLGIENRLAQQGETITLTRFRTGTMGFVAETAATPESHKRSWSNLFGLLWFREKANPCVTCLPPGSRLELVDIGLTFQTHYGVSRNEQVVFFQTTENPYTHRDAVEFNNGLQLLVQHLQEGQRAFVISVGEEETSADFTEDTTLEAERVPVNAA